ncbi:carbamoyltransferase [Thermodesulfobacteriota bacterium]
MKECILSLTTSGHGVGCSLCINGNIVGATTLERITRDKYDILLPITKNDLETFGWDGNPNIYQDSLDLPFDLEADNSTLDFNEVENFQKLIDYTLETGGVDISDVDTVTYSYRYNENVKKYFAEKNRNIEFVVPEHHLAHACQAYLPSPFDEAAIMVVDGQGVPLARKGGDQMSGCLAYGKGDAIDMLWEFPVRQSLGGLYSYITKICGFKTNEECKTMGLASYGGMEYFDRLKKEIKYEACELDLRSIVRSLKSGTLPEKQLYSFGRVESLLREYAPRAKDGEYSDMYTGIAQAGQKIAEEVMIYMADWLYEKTGSKNLCIAGGVGLNCVANYQVLSKTKFENIFVYPNAGDNGLPVGQSLYAYTMLAGKPRAYAATHDYLGKQYTREEVRSAVDNYRGRDDVSIVEFQNIEELYDVMAQRIAAGDITSWWQGRSEFGPRALGNRSILADPRNKDMKDILNSRVKFREGFRPFTPSVLKEHSGEYFSLDTESPYMLLAPYVKPGKGEVVPAITHVDNTARVQTVDREINERYYDLIQTFKKLTGIPLLLNTSFNVAGEPIVETPEDAIKCFLSTDIDVLGIDHFFLSKNKAK